MLEQPGKWVRKNVGVKKKKKNVERRSFVGCGVIKSFTFAFEMLMKHPSGRVIYRQRALRVQVTNILDTHRA